MKKILNRIPTEKEISLLLDEGYVVEVYMIGGEVCYGDGRSTVTLTWHYGALCY